MLIQIALSSVYTVFVDDNGNYIVFAKDDARISVNSLRDADYAVLWINVKGRWTKSGYLSLVQKRLTINGVSGIYLSVSEVTIAKRYQGYGYATELYKAIIRHANANIIGIVSYLTNRSNKKTIPKIYARLGAFVDESGEYQIIPIKNTSTSASRPTTNSLGQSIHKTPEGIANFWKWFGESKVVDKQGRPLVVYHGTGTKFSKVNMRKGAQSLFWFTSDKQLIEAGEVGASGKGIIMELYIKLENPANWQLYEQLGISQYASRNLDGAILTNSDGSFDGFVLSASQVKSIKNKGTFDPKKSIVAKSTVK